MEKARINDVDIAYEVRGDGEPVLLIHGALLADAMRPLAEHPSLADNKVVWYHRRGYGESSGGPSDVPTHAADAAALIAHLGIAPAHIVGHSYGGSTAMELASASPALVRSLSLLEAAIIGQIPSAAIVAEGMTPVVTPFMEGRPDEAVDLFSRAVLGADYRHVVEKSLGAAAIAQANADADDTFLGDLTSLGSWDFDAEKASAITCPVILVLGALSGEPVAATFAEFGVDTKGADMFGEMVALSQQWFPQAELVTLPGINHALQMQDADAVAGAVAPFLTKNRSAVTA